MKNIKAMIILLIIFLNLTACSQNNENANDNNKSLLDITDESEKEAEPETSHYDLLGDRDFNGDTFTILDANSLPNLFMNFPAEDGMTGEAINDALYTRDKYIEEKYGVNIEYIQITGGNGCKTLEKSVIAGENTYDLIISSVFGSSLDTLSTGNVLYNLLDAPYLSLQSPWWSKMMYENMQFNNKLFYMGGDIFLPSYSTSPAAMMFNKKMLKDYGIEENLYDLVFEGKWTIDVLEKLIQDVDADLNQDGKMHADDDCFGFICIMDETNTMLWLAGLGMKFSTVTDNMISVDFTSPDNINRIDKLTKIIKKAEYTIMGDVINKTFAGTRAMFLSHALETPQLYLRDMEDDYGILPMPKYDESQQTYVSALNPWVSGFVGIPRNVNIEKSAFLMEAMGYAGYETLRPAVYDITLKAKGARDEESERIIDIIIETAYLDLNYIYNFGGSRGILNDTVMEKKPFVSAYEKKESVIKKDIEKFMKALSLDEE